MNTDETIPVCLSIRQPWAWLIVHGYKDIENRTWTTSHRGPFLVHAGRTFDKEGYQQVARNRRIPLPQRDQLERGGIVGIVHLVKVVEFSWSRWFEGPFGFVLEEARPLPFIPCRGRLGFFRPADLTDDQIHQIRDAITV